ncbi:hypothetical protein ACUOA8_60400, partial [Escherichia sp. SS-MK2]
IDSPFEMADNTAPFQLHFPLLMIGSLLTLLPVALISRYRHQRDWRTLLLQGAALTAAALLQSLPWLWHGKESWNAL